MSPVTYAQKSGALSSTPTAYGSLCAAGTAQTVTPLLSGFLMDKLGLTVLFPYAAVFVALAFVTMLFVLHGDNKPTAKRGLEALDVED